MKFNSEQELFDEVVRYAESMDRKAVDENGNCKYRTPCGNKCLVGHLIEDDEYTSEMDLVCPMTLLGTSVESIIDRGLLSGDLVKFVDLLASLQEAHDNARRDNFKPEIVDNLKIVAKDYNLVYNGNL